MQLYRKCGIKYQDLSLDERKELLNAIVECFPEDKQDKSYILAGLQRDTLELYFDENKELVGFLTHETDMLQSFVSRLGVVKNRNKGVATKILKNHLKENDKKVCLTCVDNNEARYLYHKLGFLIEDKTQVENKIYLDFIHYPNQELNNVARVLNETYKFSKLFKNHNLELALRKMYQNKFYDNLYQYDLNNNQIDRVIQDSALFAQCLSLIDYATPEYHAFYNYNVRKNHDNMFFYFTKDEILKDFVQNKLQIPQEEQKETMRKIDEVLERVIAINKDAELVKGIKDQNIESQEQAK